jgi:hypothetical protein
MGGFGSGRYGGSVTSEGTASYILTASSLTPALRRGQRLGGHNLFWGRRIPSPDHHRRVGSGRCIHVFKPSHA